MPIVRTLLAFGAVLAGSAAAEAEPAAAFGPLGGEYAREVRPLLTRYCLDCHDAQDPEGELDLERFAALGDVRRATATWVKVAEMLDNGEMPPKEARRLSPDRRRKLRGWIDRYLHAEALARAGDPGPVPLRRLSNAEYTYTLRDLTGLDTLSPAREFPADGAAGEGFTNAGGALVMSPSLLAKYLDAAKGVADHAVLLPDRVRFSPGTTRRDRTDEALAAIRAFYARYADGEGRLPLARYLAAAIEERVGLAGGSTTPEAVAARRGLNARYLAGLWGVLNASDRSPVLDAVRARWRAAGPGKAEAEAVAAEVARWQGALSAFQKVGHMKPWVVPVSPVAAAREVRCKVSQPAEGKEVLLTLAAGDAGDGNTGDVVVWQDPRLVVPGRPDLPLRDLRAVARAALARRRKVFASAAAALAAVDEAEAAGGDVNRAALARRHGLDRDTLDAWLGFLGTGPDAAPRLDLLAAKIDGASGYDFVKGWASPDLPSLVANSSGQHVRIPGNLRPHGVAVHPTPTLSVAVGWRSPVACALKVEGKVTHAHPECGNGVTWALELRRGAVRQHLASGVAAGAAGVAVGPVGPLDVREGDLISLVIGPRDGNHACDLTDVDLTLTDTAPGGPAWRLAPEVSADVLAGNPHADRLGHPAVWHFYREPVVDGGTGPTLPAGSLLARWASAPDPTEKARLARLVQALLTDGPPAAKDHPDAALYRQLSSLAGPLVGRGPAVADSDAGTDTDGPAWGLDPARFGTQPGGPEVGPTSLCVRAPSAVEVRLPADLVAGAELVATVTLHPAAGREGSAQAQLVAGPPGPLTGLRPDTPILLRDDSAARARFEAAFAEFRTWFPAALCYSRIVPVDEVVTLALFHREDEPLQRLMLDDAGSSALDRMWADLHWVSRDALSQVDVYEQLWQYATQDSDPRLIEPYRKPIYEAAAAFRNALAAAEPAQVEAALGFASRAYRRPLTDDEAGGLRGLYRTLRSEEIPHEEAVRLLLARVLVAPAFLYRVEKAPAGPAPAPVSSWELASRLSYFLWSSAPDDELRSLAASGRLTEPDVLASQARRMLRDERARRLATEFACQWLHVYEFDTLDEKSERHFPAFPSLRGAMYEECILFFTDLFRSDGSVLSVFDADHTFVNGPLAAFYGIPGVSGPDFHRVDGMRAHGRGGILALAATLAKQSGASRTSPILRGNWVSEVLLGERLPRPPKGIPQLPDEEGEGNLTVRQMVERHSQDVRCAGCHVRIDPIGYALEGYDAIGLLRGKDAAGRPLDTRGRLQDGTELEGLNGLRTYLVTTRRDAVVRQFCRKLLGYALGRGVQLSDELLLDTMRQRLEANGYRVSAAVEAVVLSRQFRDIRGRDAAVADAR